jgi:hypothetical protein
MNNIIKCLSDRESQELKGILNSHENNAPKVIKDNIKKEQEV